MNKKSIKRAATIVGLGAVLTATMTGCQNLVQNEPVTCKVTDKDRSTGTEGQSVFRIYTEGCGADNQTLGLADNWVAGNFNSADVYASITPGKTYVFDTVGVRNGFFSSFREITSVQEKVVPEAS